MKTVKEKAYAKINLYLDVISRREDGFHNIKTVMHTLSLSDDLVLTLLPARDRSVQILVDGSAYVPTDEKNLAYKAAMLFLERAGINARVVIKLTKRIPVAAGLAGGSSDAAATLRALNKLTGKMFTGKALSDMGAVLGSDVPYCLVGKTALCEGRGEIMTRLPDTLKLYTVVAIGNEYMSAQRAYSALDEIYSSFDGSVPTGGEKAYSELMQGIKDGAITSLLFNVFESAVLPVCPKAASIKERLLSLGATHALMSGSGPSVYGIFSTADSAKEAAKALSIDGVNAFYAESV